MSNDSPEEAVPPRRRRSRQTALAAGAVRPGASLEHVARPLPDGCPVKPLGMLAGAKMPTAVFLSGAGQVVEMTGQQMSQGNLEALFTPYNHFLHRHWTRFNKEMNPDGFRAERVRTDLLFACGGKDAWSDQERLRGTGAWRGRDGTLILHLGDRVHLAGRDMPYGELDGFVYPKGAPLRGPVLGAQPDGDDGPAAELLGHLRTWNWRHPIGPRIALGWICSALIGGALRWRPTIWATGDRGSGKSFMVKMIDGIIGTNGTFKTDNTTAAAIRQGLNHRVIPVLLDELEAEEGNAQRIGQIMELLRQSSSGGRAHRGTSGHQAIEFELRSPMMAASILVPPLKSSDRSRIALLELLKRPPGAKGLHREPDDPYWPQLGARLLRRMIDGWPRFSERLATWRQELIAHLGLDERGGDQYGTLLACADLALHNLPPDPDTLREVVGRRDRDDKDSLVPLVTEASADDVPDWRRCLDHLLTYLADFRRAGDHGREPATLGHIVARAANRIRSDDPDAAQAVLANYGLRVIIERGRDSEAGEEWLAVANGHQQLARAFQGTIWAGQSGTSGGWRQALLRVPRAQPRAASLHFQGMQARVVLVPLDTALGVEGPT